jgi:hypothetical protein
MRSEESKRIFVSDLCGLMNCEAVLESKFFNRRLRELIAAPGWTIRLRPDSHNLVPVFKATLQRLHSRERCAHKDQTHILSDK